MFSQLTAHWNNFVEGFCIDSKSFLTNKLHNKSIERVVDTVGPKMPALLPNHNAKTFCNCVYTDAHGCVQCAFIHRQTDIHAHTHTRTTYICTRTHTQAYLVSLVQLKWIDNIWTLTYLAHKSLLTAERTFFHMFNCFLDGF